MQEEHELKKQMTNLTTSMKLTAMKEAHAQSRETMYQAAFDKLRRLTGIMDIRQMVRYRHTRAGIVGAAR